MMTQKTYDPVLEEMWAIKRELAAEYPSLDAYFQSILDEQEERKKKGVRFVSFPARRPIAFKRLNMV